MGSVKLTNLSIKAFYFLADHAIRELLDYVPQGFPNFGLAFFSTSLNLLLQIKSLVIFLGSLKTMMVASLWNAKLIQSFHIQICQA